MKFFNVLIFSSLFSALANTAFSQTSSTITNIGIDAKVIAPIEASKSSDLNFGTITRSSTSGSVKIDFASEGSGFTITPSGGVSILTSAFSGATFEITGENNAIYSFNLPSGDEVILTRKGGTEVMTVTGFDDNSVRVLSDTGTDSFSIVATLNVGANQVAGDYEGDFSITISYQ